MHTKAQLYPIFLKSNHGTTKFWNSTLIGAASQAVGQVRENDKNTRKDVCNEESETEMRKQNRKGVHSHVECSVVKCEAWIELAVF